MWTEEYFFVSFLVAAPCVIFTEEVPVFERVEHQGTPQSKSCITV
jgi:hypothetical protein